MKIELLASIISTIAAIFSAIAAAFSTRIAKQALQLSQVDAESKSTPLVLYLNEGFRHRQNTSESYKSILAFSVSVTNISTLPNSILRMELHVDCLAQDGRKSEYALPHDSSLSQYIKSISLTPFETPTLLNPKESQSRWAFFSESEVIPATLRRDCYRLVVTDSNGSSSSVTSLIVKDLSSEKN